MNQQLGVALTKCFYCGSDFQILIAKRILSEAGAEKFKEHLHGKVVDMSPCDKCKEWMRQGIIIITIDEARSDANWNKPPDTEHQTRGSSYAWKHPDHDRQHWMPNPFRTGGFFVIKEEAFKRLFGDVPENEVMAHALKARWIFMEHEAAVQLGLGVPKRPREGVINKEQHERGDL